MSTPYLIPFSGLPERFSITLVNVTYNFSIRFNEACPAWVLDIYDVNDVLMVGGIPLITGADLLAQYGYLGFGFQLIVQSVDVTHVDSVVPLQDVIDRAPGWGDLNRTGFAYAVVP